MRGGHVLDVGGRDLLRASGRVPRPGPPWRPAPAGSRRAGAGAPLGSLSTVPVEQHAVGSSPFIAAIASTETPVCAASPASVSPARTV